MDLEWPMIDIPQELREMRGEDDFNSRSNTQANAIKVKSKSEMKIGNSVQLDSIERKLLLRAERMPLFLWLFAAFLLSWCFRS